MRPNLPLLRSRAERFMVDECEVTKPGEGQGPWNPTTGQYDPPLPVVLYAGKVMIRPQPRDATIVASDVAPTYAASRYDVSLPATATDVVRTNTLTITACEGNPELIGLPFTLVDVQFDAWAVARRCVAELPT